LLCLQPEPVEQLAAVLADCLSEQRPDVVCGPLVEGRVCGVDGRAAYEGAIHLHRAHRDAKSDEMFPVSYRLPGRQREHRQPASASSSSTM
jgi:hypothetical protein